jgi:hypothetical protein
MKKLFLVLLIIFSCIFSGNAQLFKVAPKVMSYFEVQPYIKPYIKTYNEKFTILLDNDVKDSILVQAPSLIKMWVIEFRKSAKKALENTYSTSFQSVNFRDSIQANEVTIVVYRIQMAWNKVNSTTRTNVYGSGGYTNGSSYTNYEVNTQVKYDAAIYRNGQKLGVISREVFSDMTTTKSAEMPEIVKDGVKKMCEDLYQESIKLL